MARVKVRKVTKSWMKLRPDRMDEVKEVIRHPGGSKVETVKYEVGTWQVDVAACSCE